MTWGDKMSKAEIDDIFNEFEIDEDYMVKTKEVVGLFVAVKEEEKKEEKKEEAPVEAAPEEDEGDAKRKRRRRRRRKKLLLKLLQRRMKVMPRRRRRRRRPPSKELLGQTVPVFHCLSIIRIRGCFRSRLIFKHIPMYYLCVILYYLNYCSFCVIMHN